MAGDDDGGDTPDSIGRDLNPAVTRGKARRERRAKGWRDRWRDREMEEGPEGQGEEEEKTR